MRLTASSVIWRQCALARSLTLLLSLLISTLNIMIVSQVLLHLCSCNNYILCSQVNSLACCWETRVMPVSPFLFTPRQGLWHHCCLHCRLSLEGLWLHAYSVHWNYQDIKSNFLSVFLFISRSRSKSCSFLLWYLIFTSANSTCFFKCVLYRLLTVCQFCKIHINYHSRNCGWCGCPSGWLSGCAASGSCYKYDIFYEHHITDFLSIMD